MWITVELKNTRESSQSRGTSDSHSLRVFTVNNPLIPPKGEGKWNLSLNTPGLSLNEACPQEKLVKSESAGVLQEPHLGEEK